jgi:hypothetical protein
LLTKSLLSSFNSAQDTGSVETLYESCFIRTQLWPHVTQHKAPRRRTSVGFSLFIAEPAELRGTSVDLLPPGGANSSFFVYVTRGEDSNCRQFVQTWNGVRCTLQLPYIDISCPHISRHHATLLYKRDAFELNGIGLADGHFDFQTTHHEDPEQKTARVDCPCNLPNPQGKICSDQGTFVLAFPPAGKDSERRVLMRKPVHTAADTFKIASDGGFVMLDGLGASFMYFMLGNVVIGISDPVVPPPDFIKKAHWSAGSPPPRIAQVGKFPPPPPSPTPPSDFGDLGSPLPCPTAPSDFGPTSPAPYTPNDGGRRSFPSMLSTMLHSRESLGKGTVNEMEQGGWEKMASCWND